MRLAGVEVEVERLYECNCDVNAADFDKESEGKEEKRHINGFFYGMRREFVRDECGEDGEEETCDADEMFGMMCSCSTLARCLHDCLTISCV